MSSTSRSKRKSAPINGESKKQATFASDNDAYASNDTSAVQLARDAETIKTEASRLKKIISDKGVDVVSHLKKRLDSGDYDTVKLLKAIYPTGNVQKCLLCRCEIAPGSKKKCILYHDVDWYDFRGDGYRSGNGTHIGDCERCGETVELDGDEEDFVPSDMSCGRCYTGKHVFTEEDNKKVMAVFAKKQEEWGDLKERKRDEQLQAWNNYWNSVIPKKK